MSVLVVRWSGFAVPPVLLSSEQLFTDRAGPVQSNFPVIKFVIIAGYNYKHTFTRLSPCQQLWSRDRGNVNLRVATDSVM